MAPDTAFGSRAGRSRAFVLDVDWVTSKPPKLLRRMAAKEKRAIRFIAD